MSGESLHPSFRRACYHVVNADRGRETRQNKQDPALDRADPPIRRAAAFDSPEWIYELKYDGFRALAYMDPDRPRLISRNHNRMTRFENLDGAGIRHRSLHDEH